jgi:transcriptional regulator with XRE-family HTH domain
LSQRELASLVGVTLGAVALWEKGKFRPGADKKAILIALRKLGKREVRKIFLKKSEEKPKKKTKKARARK